MGSLDRIVILGMPRSGTTWFAKIFDSHPNVLYRHEPDTWARWSNVPLYPAADDDQLVTQVREHSAGIRSMTADRVAGKLPFFPKDYVSNWAFRRFQLETLVRKAGERLGYQMRPGRPLLPEAGKPYRLVWKSIESLGRAGLIARADERNRIIHIIRHPCGYVASVLRGEQGEKFSNSRSADDKHTFEMLCDTPQGRRAGLRMNLLFGLTEAERLAWRWRIVNEKATEELAALGAGTQVYYERLCGEPLTVAQEAFAYCDLNWNAQTEQFLSASITRSSDGYYSVFKNPLESAWNWSQKLSPDDIVRIGKVVKGSQVAAPYYEAVSWVKIPLES